MRSKSILVILIILVGCNQNSDKVRTQTVIKYENKETNFTIDSLLASNDSLSQRIKELHKVAQNSELKTNYILSITRDLNDIENKLLSLGRIQSNLLLESNSFESKLNQVEYNTKTTVFKAIDGYENELKNYKNKIKVISNNINEYKSEYENLYLANKNKIEEISELKILIDNLYQQIKERDQVISLLTTKIELLANELKTIKSIVYTGYYIIGDDKYLLQQNLIEEKGNVNLGLFSVGGAFVEKAGYNSNNYKYNSIDITKNYKLHIGNYSSINILPSRPNNIYDYSYGSLIIKNAEIFWRDKYLIVIVEE